MMAERSFTEDNQKGARAAVVHDLHLALGWLAAWCPHGMDSSRALDYFQAKHARRAITEALIVLGESVPQEQGGVVEGGEDVAERHMTMALSIADHPQVKAALEAASGEVERLRDFLIRADYQLGHGNPDTARRLVREALEPREGLSSVEGGEEV